MKWLEQHLAQILDVGIFFLLCLFGVVARLCFEMEIHPKRRYKFRNFFNRLFVTLVFAFVIEIFISKNEKLRDFYAQIILTFAFFTVDIINFGLKYRDKILLYILGTVIKGMNDIQDTIRKKES